MSEERQRLAVVLFNLGGPDQTKAVRPFLLNLFRDPAILRVPAVIRIFLACIIAFVRTRPAIAIYAQIGGGSPLLELTQRQAQALETALTAILPSYATKCFIAMRYWHPLSDATARAVRDFAPDEILLLPLYPQYSTTTSGSSLTAWREASARAGLVARTTSLCCYPDDLGFIRATAELLRASLDDVRKELLPGGEIRILFSAHGLPEKIITAGDPYQQQIERSTQAVLAQLTDPPDSVICYQSRVTPVQWLRPSTEDEIARAGRDGVGVLIVPIAFVSDHSETLVELDIEYFHHAQKSGVPLYRRVPVPNDFPPFIAALASLAQQALAAGPGLCAAGHKICPHVHRDCPHHRAAFVS